MITRLESAYNTISIGERWEREGDLRQAHMCYETVITDFMHLSFVNSIEVDSVKTWLSDHPLDLVTDRFTSICTEILQMPQSQWARFFQSGNYLLIAFSHFFSVLGQHDRARFFIQTAVQPTMSATPFWGEYANSLWALVRGQEYTPEFGRLKKVERYWRHYVDLMSCATRHQDVDAAVVEIDRQFALRNKDTSVHDDAYIIEGTGEFPIQFDFRKAGLLAVIDIMSP